MTEEELRKDLKEIGKNVTDIRLDLGRIRGDIARVGQLEARIESVATTVPKFEIRLDRLERTQAFQGRFFWIVTTAIIALVVKSIWSLF